MMEKDPKLTSSESPPDNKIWNPWIDVVQDEALDLSKKKEEQTPVNEKESQLCCSGSHFPTRNMYENMDINRNSERKAKRMQAKTDTFKKSSRKLETKRRAKTKKKIESIKESCDCRFCYEDHILKMRMKTSKPYVF